MASGVSVALRTQMATLYATRALRLLVVLAGGALVLLLGLRFVGLLSADALEQVRHALLTVAVPLGGVLVAELPVREGLRSRTLLYPLMGPVGRSALLFARTLVAFGLLVLALGALLVLFGAASAATPWALGRELLALVLGAAAYVSVFGLVHLFTARGLVGGILFFVIVDSPVGRLPLTLRFLVPSAHVHAVAGLAPPSDLALALAVSEPNAFVSAAVLCVIAFVGFGLTAFRFSRMSLEELC